MTLLAALVLLLCPLTASAQVTTVTGTVTDLSGLPYAGGQLKAQLVLAGANVTGQPVVTVNNNAQCASAGQGSAPCKIPFQGTNGPLALDPTGSFTLNLQDNTQVTPASTQWLFTITINNLGPPIGTGPQTCSVTTTISGASQSVTSLLNTCPALSAGNLNSLPATGVTLSQNCGKTVAPCIQIPPGGGCFNGAFSTAGGLITFNSGFPANVAVGQEAWVQTEQDGGLCNDTGTALGVYAQTLFCGGLAAPRTITSITPGVSLQLSGGCAAQSNANSMLFYGPNIHTQLRIACAAGLGAPHIAAGFYVLDNSADGTNPDCGNLTSATPGAQGEGIDITYLLSAPWHNHAGDTGTVINGPISNLTLDGTWTNLGLSHGTPNYTGCGGHDYSIRGFNFGNTATSEMLYPAASVNPNTSACSLRNITIITGNRGIATGGGGTASLTNVSVISQSMAVFDAGNGTNNTVVNILGGYYSAGGVSQNGTGVFGTDSGVVPNGDHFIITNAQLCMTGNANIFNVNEASVEWVLTNVKMNSAVPQCVPGTNAGGFVGFSGTTVRAQQTDFRGNGTGNPLNLPSGATFDDNCGNTSSGGAAFSVAGTYVPAGGCAINDAAPTISSGFGTTPSIASGASVSSFQVNVGTGGVATSGVIGLPTSPKTGWNCQVQDSTTNVATRQTANTATTATLTAAAAWTASDILIVGCRPY